ncbi:MAG: hypothetical protein OEQ29_18030 [Alphaproteobacteria bacterium]|nr:hypothetical protein [Alphaproteobacteria bacterium]
MVSEIKTTPIIEKVASAIYKTTVQQAYEEIDNMKFDCKDMVKVYSNVLKESPTGISIITFAYMDEVILRLLRLIIGDQKEDIIAQSFGFGGPLDSFSSRAKISYLFGFIRIETLNNLDQFRRIRNAFAHKPFDLSFRSLSIKDRVGNIDVDVERLIKEIRKNEDIRSTTISYSKLNLLQMFLVKSALTTGFLISEMMALPVARRFRVSPHHFLTDYDDLPGPLRNVRSAVAECLLDILKKRS